MKTDKKQAVLPNAHVAREQCVPACDGCNKQFVSEELGTVCIAYVSPKALQRRGCALQSNKPLEVEAPVKKVNALKASKRAAKGK